MTRAEEMVERVARAMCVARALPGTDPVARLSDVDRRAARAASAIVVEACAGICLEVNGLIGTRYGSSIDIALNEAARTIRALHPAPQQGASDD